MLEIARIAGPWVYYLIAGVIAISIFTTMLTAMSGLADWFVKIFGSRAYSSVLVLLTALALSNLGFTNVVAYLYPVTGVMGVIYISSACLYALRVKVLAKPCEKLFDKINTHVHQRRKAAKNDG
jgi:uncharacterized membrane protein YkvI